MANNNRRRFGGFFSGPGFGSGGAGGAGGGAHSLIGGAGGIFIGFILIIIGGGLLLTGDLNPLPQDQLSDPPEGVYEIDEESLKELDEKRGNLQLRTIRFKECGEQTTIVLMLDKSGSMNSNTPSGARKIDRLIEAVVTLANSLSDESVIGVQDFSNPTGVVGQNDINTLIPVSFYKDVKTQVEPAVRSLSGKAVGSTPTHDALAYSYSELLQAMPLFPDKQFDYIFVSDGAPCPGIGCGGTVGGPDQDPRLYSPNPADQIKELGVNIYTLGIYDLGQNKSQLSALLRDIASTPDNYFEATTADDTGKLLTAISERICQSVGAGNNQ